jgi:hypothetical protein
MKGALEVLTRYLAKDLGRRGITANTVAAGAITTLGRVRQSDDIGPMIALLLDEGNRWITGQRIEVSGGMMLRSPLGPPILLVSDPKCLCPPGIIFGCAPKWESMRSHSPNFVPYELLWTL